MLIQNNVKSHVIIGEAALSLALGDQQISVSSLICTLSRMAKTEKSENRLLKINEAKDWLQSFESPEYALKEVPYLQTLAGVNEERH